jgi:hypothetical protein
MRSAIGRKQPFVTGVAGAVLCAALAAGCDVNPTDQPPPPGPAVKLLGANVSAGQALPASGRLELLFNRLLLPATISPSTFLLKDASGNAVSPSPAVAFDPVARVVTVTPAQPLDPAQQYSLTIAVPASSTDVKGLRAIDGTPAPSGLGISSFSVQSGGSPPTAIGVDFCKDVRPIFKYNCTAGLCHGGMLPAEGLELDSNAGVVATAIGMVAHGANTGQRAAPAAPELLFDEDMPVVDAQRGQSQGRPDHSRLIYKVLMGLPTTTPCTPGENLTPGQNGCLGLTDAGPPVDITGLYSAVLPSGPQGLQDDPGDRDILANLIPGREMPFPMNPAAPPLKLDPPYSLALDQMERLSLWIAEGALVPDTCP